MVTACGMLAYAARRGLRPAEVAERLVRRAIRPEDLLAEVFEGK